MISQMLGDWTPVNEYNGVTLERREKGEYVFTDGLLTDYVTFYKDGSWTRDGAFLISHEMRETLNAAGKAHAWRIVA